MNILIDGQTLETPEVHRGIGVYFKNVLNNMVKQSFQHNWYITLSNEESVKYLDSWVAKRIKIITSNKFVPGSDFERTDAYTEELYSVIKQYKIDVLWLANPLMVNVLFPNKGFSCNVFATIYDLIPLVMPVAEWSHVVRDEYKRRLQFIKEENIHLLCISEATRKDFTEYVGKVPDMRVTFLAADTRLFYKPRKIAGLSDTPNMVFTGGFDYRKNLEGALKSLKIAKEKYKGSVLEDIKFYIICHCDENTQKRFNEKLKLMNLENNVTLTGFVSDEELADYYANADVFFFPSLYEGFGLPIIEAMLGGAYIVSGDNSSLPEVCGEYALLGDSENEEQMADLLYQAFENVKCESLEDKHSRQSFAYDFSWEKTAEETLKAFEDSKTNKVVVNKKQKIAIVTPWPYQRSGIANYVYKLLPYLDNYYIIDVFVDKSSEKNCSFRDNLYGHVYDIHELDEKHTTYSEIIYHIGNNSKYHTKIYDYLLKYPGIAEIHDYILQPFFYYSFIPKEEEKFLQALEDGYGVQGKEYYKKIMKKVIRTDDDMDIEKFPMSHSVQANTKATIYHNHWSKDQMKSKENVYVIPHASFDRGVVTNEKKAQIIKTFKKNYNIKDEIIVGCFGYVNENKRPDRVLQAVSGLIKEGYKIKLIYFGECNMNLLLDLIRDNDLEKEVFIAGYLDNEEYEAGLEMTDIVVNLRYPSMGEASGTLCEALKYGKPVLVSQLNQYMEYPDEICWKVPIGKYEVAILKRMIAYLTDHNDVRNALGRNAKAYADKVLNCGKIAEMYFNVIESVNKEEEQ